MTASSPGPGGPPFDEQYAGSADSGVVGSVGESAPAAGDVVQVLRAEHTKLQHVLDEMARLARGEDREALRLRWGGVARELVEHETAQSRVVLPAAENAVGADAVADVRRGQQQLLDRLQEHDAFTADDVGPQEISSVIDLASEQLRLVDAVLLPVLQQLPRDERERLGEDMRQVMG